MMIGLTFFSAAATAPEKITAVQRNSGRSTALHAASVPWKKTVGSIPQRALAISPTTAARNPYIAPLTIRLLLKRA